MISWLDDTHVAALRSHENGEGADLVAVNVEDGSNVMLSARVDMARPAIDLLDSPVKDQPVPPRPWSPWVPTVAAGATLVLAVVAIVIWRRRARA